MGKAKIEPCVHVKELFTPVDIIQMEDTPISKDSNFKYSYNNTVPKYDEIQNQTNG